MSAHEHTVSVKRVAAPASAPSTFGPNPWQQQHWDWRASANFVCGGFGSGLLVLTAFASLFGLGGVLLSLLVLVALASIGLGLFFVWLEIGRPLRALHVFFNPQTSWMTREGFIAVVLMPVGLLAAWRHGPWLWIAALLALVFMFCQGRILHAAKGIPAWREPSVVSLLMLSALAEGAGLLFVLAPGRGLASPWLAGALALLVAGRFLAWLDYRERIDGKVVAHALRALDEAGRVLLALGTIAPLALMAVALFAPQAAPMLAVSAGLAVAFGSAQLKHVLITRAAFNQGFALKKLPVRGVAR